MWHIPGIGSILMLGGFSTLRGFGILSASPSKNGENYPSNEAQARVLRICGPGLLIGGIFHLVVLLV
jgi:hypothetical protein